MKINKNSQMYRDCVVVAKKLKNKKASLPLTTTVTLPLAFSGQDLLRISKLITKYGFKVLRVLNFAIKEFS